MTVVCSIDFSLCWLLFVPIDAGFFLERTRQTTVGAILIDTHASVAMYFC